MKKLYLTAPKEKHLFLFVEDEHYDLIKDLKIYFFNNCSGPYYNPIGHRKIFIGRLLYGLEKKDIIHYKNGNKLDLRKENVTIFKSMRIEELEDIIVLKFNLGIGIVDKMDKELIYKYNWNMTPYGYVRCSNFKNGKGKFLHEIILNPREGYFTDHINGDRGDNRRCNLREVTNAQNKMNSKLSKNNRFGYKGVTLFHGEIIAQIGLKRKYIRIGPFDTPEEAALAYNQKALELFGEFAKLNDVPNQQQNAVTN